MNIRGKDNAPLGRALYKWIKEETVLCAAILLAVVSSIIVRPDAAYAGYLDYRTLGLLFCLMTVMAGFQKLGVFYLVAQKLLGIVKGSSQMSWILVMLCFFFSMLITNDVSLITFVPFTLTVLRMKGKEAEKKLLIPITVLQTIAANLGSMLTPIGNPQNLYLYGKAGMSVAVFLKMMLPFTVAAFVLLTVCCFIIGRDKGNKEKECNSQQAKYNMVVGEETACKEARIGIHRQGGMPDFKKLLLYLLLFFACLLGVARLLPWYLVTGVVLIGVLWMDRQILKKVDYSLLFTFAGFFVFIGNMGRIEGFCSFLRKIMEGHEVITAIAASQIISNVPAALLLSGFTDNTAALIIGTNLGGLGTLIASMASLITYKLISRDRPEDKGKYFVWFTIANVFFLVVLTGCYLYLKS